MASFPDLTVTDADWVDLYTTISTPTTNTLQFQNKGSVTLLYQEAATKPLSSNWQGFAILPLSPTKTVLPKSGEKVWVRSSNLDSVREDSTILAIVLG